jgi:hypothetical protein
MGQQQSAPAPPPPKPAPAPAPAPPPFVVDKSLWLTPEESARLKTNYQMPQAEKDMLAKIEADRQALIKQQAEHVTNTNAGNLFVQAIQTEAQNELASTIKDTVAKVAEVVGILPGGGETAAIASAVIPAVFQSVMGDVPDPAGAQARMFKAVTGKDLPPEYEPAPARAQDGQGALLRQAYDRQYEPTYEEEEEEDEYEEPYYAPRASYDPYYDPYEYKPRQQYRAPVPPPQRYNPYAAPPRRQPPAPMQRRAPPQNFLPQPQSLYSRREPPRGYW